MPRHAPSPDWKTVLANPDADLMDFGSMAGQWNSCAIGEARKLYKGLPALAPRFGEVTDEPVDRSLLRLGVAFGNHVTNGRKDAAIRTYKAIHARILTLILGGAK